MSADVTTPQDVSNADVVQELVELRTAADDLTTRFALVLPPLTQLVDLQKQTAEQRTRLDRLIEEQHGRWEKEAERIVTATASMRRRIYRVAAAVLAAALVAVAAAGLLVYLFGRQKSVEARQKALDAAAAAQMARSSCETRRNDSKTAFDAYTAILANPKVKDDPTIYQVIVTLQQTAFAGTQVVC